MKLRKAFQMKILPLTQVCTPTKFKKLSQINSVNRTIIKGIIWLKYLLKNRN